MALLLVGVLASILNGCVADARAAEVLRHGCAHEQGVGSRAHSNALDRLNGRKLVFVGDSISRYQYLELASYIVTGRCPAQNRTDYILSERSWQQWPAFYRGSSDQLNTRSDTFRATETCFCTRERLLPGEVNEQRSFLYSDIEGRDISLAYVQYFTEAYGPLEGAVAMAEALRPTDVMLAFGLWLQWAPKDCAQQTPPTPQPGPGTAPFRKQCPSMNAICKRFKPGDLEELNRPYRLWWQTPPPVVKNGTLVEVIERSHHLNVRVRCSLSDAQVIDRRGALDALETDRAKQRRLYWEGQGEVAHLHAEANHAFNHAVLAKFEPAPPPARRRRSTLAWLFSTDRVRRRRRLAGA